jgi:hypothetical protein
VGDGARAAGSGGEEKEAERGRGIHAVGAAWRRRSQARCRAGRWGDVGFPILYFLFGGGFPIGYVS